jgi:hypothetical protein
MHVSQAKTGKLTMQAAITTSTRPYVKTETNADQGPRSARRTVMRPFRHVTRKSTALPMSIQTTPVRIPVKMATRFLAKVRPVYLHEPVMRLL